MVVISELLQPSSSSSTTHADHHYDVFLSFRGIDTRLNFTDHLHQALVGANIATFLDDEEIETGQDLKPELESAIKASRASIIVLSQNYASSTWCLDELVLILDQMRISGHVVIPIFYHVEPTDVRKQQSSFGIAMEKHKQRMEAETNVEEKVKLGEKMDKWKKALVQVVNLKGMDANGRQETKFIEEIVKDIYHQLGVPLRSTLPLLYGMEYDIQFITSWVKDGSSHTADVLTICGLAGIGKTTLARYVYELHCRSFDRSSFIEGVNEKCTQQVNGLLDLQKRISHDISKRSSIHTDDGFRYTSIIENALACQKVFIVLDDIGSLEQLDTLLGKKGFHPGSKIIITTKDSSVNEKYKLINSVVQPKHTKIFLRGLGVTASLQLLSFHAFKGNRPEKRYEEVSEKLTEYCQGHPLALKVLGESLYNRDVAEWEERIEELKKVTDSRVQKVLQMSFDSMPSDNDKELFKHIACFFVGKDKDDTVKILKACDIPAPRHGISNLIDRCLLTIRPRNQLEMHQLLQEMGRDFVRQESPNKPWKRSRLWCHKESFNVLEQNKGSRKVAGLVLDMRMLEKEETCESFELKIDALSKMDNLMLLQLNHVKFDGPCKNFPKKIRWLCMHGFPSKSLPSDLPMENIVALDMSYSKLKSFGMSYGYPQQPGKRQKLSSSCSKGKQLLGSLKILNLSFCKQLHSLGGFSEFPALEELILANCTSLMEVCESIEQCDQLDLIDLSYCNEIGKILRMIVKLKVKTLKLEGCRNLSEFQIEMRDPKMLKANNISMDPQTSSSAIVETIPRAIKSYLVYLPSSLVSLSLRDCKLSNESFPMDMSSLSMLKELCLNGNDIVSMPSCVRTLPTIEKLSIDYCRRLTTIEHPPRTLKHLIFDFLNEEGKVLFEREMSPLLLECYDLTKKFRSVDGVFKLEDMADVEEEVLRSLGWSNLDFTKFQPVETESKIQMLYEFGIFSTLYVGNEMPNWISHKSKGLPLSFTIPSSRNNLRGLNFCCVHRVFGTSRNAYIVVKISNVTKKCTWIYFSPRNLKSTKESIITCLSYWMLGKNEMEDGDQIAISILKVDRTHDFSMRECGVSLVYDEDDDDGKNKMEEEDVLSYYKSWNHIISGDLSPFQTTRGEYLLNRKMVGGLPFELFAQAREYNWWDGTSKGKCNRITSLFVSSFNNNNIPILRVESHREIFCWKLLIS